MANNPPTMTENSLKLEIVQLMIENKINLDSHIKTKDSLDRQVEVACGDNAFHSNQKFLDFHHPVVYMHKS